MRTPRSLLPALLLGALACSEPIPEASGPTPPPPDLTSSAFELRINGATGEVRVTPPSSPAAVSTGGKFANSMLGRDAVELSVGTCSFTPIPNNGKQRRCTLPIRLTNRLTVTDLVTATTFPKPPQGVNGLIVFPYTSAALGVTGGAATPNDAWDGAPANFFNDFSGCAAGKTSDCYRYEVFPGPLYGGESTGWRDVGFDVDKAAYDVAVYVVVAADLRENLPQQLVLPTLACTRIARNADGYDLIGTNSWTVSANIYAFGTERVLCIFPLDQLSGRKVRRASVRFVQEFVEGNPFGNGLGPVVVDWYRVTTTPVTFQDLWNGNGNVTTMGLNLGTLADAFVKDAVRSVDVTSAVLSDVSAGLATTSYRVRFRFDVDGASGATGFYKGGPDQPALVVEYVNQ